MSENNRRAYSRTLSDIIPKIAATSIKKRGFIEARIITDWRMIVGSAIASVSLPFKMIYPKNQNKHATLHIKVAGAWALELSHMEPIIIDKISTYIGYKAVDKIRLIQAPLMADYESMNWKTPEVPILNELMNIKLQRTLQNENNEELKSVLTRLGAWILSKQ